MEVVQAVETAVGNAGIVAGNIAKKLNPVSVIVRSINERRDVEEPKEVTIKISNKTQPEEVTTQQTCTVPVTLKDDARSVVKASLAQFQFQNGDPNEYQLYVLAKEAMSMPLIGHELPYAIRMNSYRSLHEYTHDENDNQYEQTTSIDNDGKLQFVLKKKKSGNRANMDINNQKKWKNPIKKSPIINWAMNKKTVKPAFNHQESLPPGKLFGNPLVQLSTEEEVIPKPIEDLLSQLFRKGPGTTGIFRKSALQRTAREIRQSLDIGKEVDFSTKSAVVLATVLKDFFRSLPDSLIVSEHYDSLVATKSIADADARIEEVKRILQQFHRSHYELVMRFLCALYHIQRFSERNNMNSYNLSICVSPSIMWPTANSKLAATEQASASSDFVCFLIDNYINVFSKENEYLLGTEEDIQLDDVPGEDSDSGTDQVIYPYGDADDREDSEKENEPSTPDFLVAGVDDNDHVFSHSDSSLNTNDSDELKTSSVNKLSIPNNTLISDCKQLGSHSSPSSPLTRKKGVEKSLSSDIRVNSDMSDQESPDHDHFKRQLLRAPRHKRILSSTTASAELIEHRRNPSESLPGSFNDSFRKIDNDESSSRRNSSNSSNDNQSNSSRRGSKTLSGSILVPQKHVISQPIIQHFATEYRPTPNIIFHSVDRRRLPAAPSYEEHIQRTQQTKQRTVQSNVKKPLVVAHATLVQHQSAPMKPKKESIEDIQHHQQILRTAQIQRMSVEEKPGIASNSSSKTSVHDGAMISPKSSTSSQNEEKRVGTVTRKPRVDKDKQRSPRSPRSQFTSPKKPTEDFFAEEPMEDDRKLSEKDNIVLQELLDDLAKQDNNVNATLLTTKSAIAATTTNSNTIDTNKTTPPRNNSREEIEKTFDSMLQGLDHNVQLMKTSQTDSSPSPSDSPRIITRHPKNSQTATSKKPPPPPTAPKPKNSSFKKKSGSISSPANDSTVSDIPLPVAPQDTNNEDDSISDLNFSPSVDNVFIIPKKDENNENFEQEPINSLPVSLSLEKVSSVPTSPKISHQGPFSLGLKKSDSKRNPLNSSTDGKSQSIVLEKTLLTKAPKKIDQLTNKLGERKDDGKIITARELRRTNRKLKSEIRNAFNDGFNLPQKDIHSHNSSKLNGRYNGHISTDSERGRTQQLRLMNKENFNKMFHMQQTHQQQQQQPIIQCNEKNNNNTISTSPRCSASVPFSTTGLFTNTSTGMIVNDDELQQDEAYAKIMSQAESYV